jgi:hypothetical protein
MTEIPPQNGPAPLTRQPAAGIDHHPDPAEPPQLPGDLCRGNNPGPATPESGRPAQ